MTIVFYVDIEKLMRRYGMTMSEMAKLTGLSQGHLSNIKKSKAISISSLSKIATGLGEKDILKLVDTRIEEKTKS